MNCFTFIRRGIDAAVREQIAAYERGETLEQSTYDYDPDTDRLTVHRSKEEADDYRYFPEPDLVPVDPPARARRAAARRAAGAARRAHRAHRRGRSATTLATSSCRPATSRRRRRSPSTASTGRRRRTSR